MGKMNDTITREYDEAMKKIQVQCTVQDYYYSQDELDRAVELKRAGKYIESSRIYADLALQKGCLAPVLVKGWYKTLAAAGNTAEAVKLVVYMIQNLPDSDANRARMIVNMQHERATASDNDAASVYAHAFILNSLMEGRDYLRLEGYLKQISGNSNYSLHEVWNRD